MSWLAVGGAVVGAGASIYGARKNADAIEDGNDLAARTQQQALDATLAISRPTQQLANSAQRQLAALFGLPDPGEIDFNAIGGSGRSGVFSPGGGLNGDQQAAVDAFTQTFGFDPIANPQQALGIDQRSLPSDRLRDRLNSFTSTFGYDPTREAGNPYYDPALKSEQAASSASSGFTGNLTELISNSPLTKFNIQQGEKAIARGAAARGLNASGRTLQDLATFNTDQTLAASQNMVLNPLFQLAGFGPQANAQAGGVIQSTANNASNLAVGSADARGSAYQSGFNALGNVANDIGGAISLRSLLNQNQSNSNTYNPSPPAYTLFGVS